MCTDVLEGAEARLRQKELAEMAGIREETLCRIETGKSIPSVPTIDKIDRALKRAGRRAKSRTNMPIYAWRGRNRRGMYSTTTQL
jgi:DNA-binding XRE family transcriptional regulator